MVATDSNGLGVFTLFLGQSRLQQETRHADDAVHRRSDFMTHGREEGRFCFGRGLGFFERGIKLLIDPLQLLSILLQRLLRFLPTGDVTNECTEDHGTLDG